MSMKKRISISRDTFYDKRFKSLSPETQLAYVHLLFNADITGLVFSPEDLGGRLNDSNLQELLDAGLLIDCDGEVFITRMWLENRFENRWMKKLEECDAYRSGRIAFSGEVGHSEYVLVDGPEENLTKSCQKFDKSLTPKCKGKTKGNAKPNDTLSESSSSQNLCLGKGGVGGNPSNSIWTRPEDIPFEDVDGSFNENEPIEDDAVPGTERMQPGDLTTEDDGFDDVPSEVTEKPAVTTQCMCPGCHKTMTSVTRAHETVAHCDGCGGHWVYDALRWQRIDPVTGEIVLCSA